MSAIQSAAVYRLKHTLAAMPDKLSKALAEGCELNSDHNRKYQEQLRSINVSDATIKWHFLIERFSSCFLFSRLVYHSLECK